MSSSGSPLVAARLRVAAMLGHRGRSMTEMTNHSWLRVAMLVAIVYPVVGVAFAAFGNASISHEALVAWRLAAWLVSGVAFLVHLWYEHFRLRNSPSRAALHVSVAVALGAFALAVWVNVHGYWVASGRQSSLTPLALILFPAVTGVPAYVIALVAGVILPRIRPGSH